MQADNIKLMEVMNLTELEAIFKKHFESGMINKDFEAFKKSHPTLLKVIISSMADANNEAN